jgi:curved DNA-binding protein CbpA
MIDHFSILGQPRRPWLDPEEVKDAFHRLGASLHPDVPGTGDAAQFTALNAAWSVLREPASRLRHLLELTAPEALAGAAPPPLELADLFMEIAGVRRRLDALLGKRKAATSPLTRALLASEEADLRREIQSTLGRLQAAEAASLAEVRVVDSAWNDPTPEAVAALVRSYHRLAYLARWLAQTRESLFALGG